MIFDFVKDLKIPGKGGKKFGGADKLYEYCLAAERNVRTNPDFSMFKIRQAVETLVWSLLMEDGNVEFNVEPKNNIESKNKVNIDLVKLINTYAKKKYCKFIKNKRVGSLHHLRNSINVNYMHVYVDDRGEEGYEIVGENATWEDAFDTLKLLNTCIRKIFELEDKQLRVIDCPIGKYQIEKSIHAKDYESIAGNYKYIGREHGIGMDTFVYIRPFNVRKDGVRDVFNSRDLEVQHFFKNMKSSNHIIQGSEIPVEEYCDIHYMAYEIYKNTQTLDELVEKGLSPEQVLDIILQVAQGLTDLMTDRINIHHRAIQPTCIFVTPFENEFQAQLGCFETAKIEYVVKEMGTIDVETMKKIQKDNVFVHPKLINKPAGTSGKDWEAGDVYSLATIILFCIDRNAVSVEKKDCSVLLEYFSDQFFDEMEMILGTESLEMVPSMKEFCSILENENVRLEYS